MVDVEKIDQHLKFLRAEIEQLDGRAEVWAARKKRALESIVDTLAEVRRDKQMTTISGKRLE
jgi:hypothetical protein